MGMPSPRIRRGLLLFILHPSSFILLLSGCGGPGYEVAPVSGRVTLGGQPMAGLHVSFQPVAEGKKGTNPGPGSYATTGPDGRYTLRTIDPDGPGAVVGKHVVRIAPVQPQGNPASDEIVVVRNPLPATAGDGSLRFDVPPGGTDKADFELRR